MFFHAVANSIHVVICTRLPYKMYILTGQELIFNWFRPAVILYAKVTAKNHKSSVSLFYIGYNPSVTHVYRASVKSKVLKEEK